MHILIIADFYRHGSSRVVEDRASTLASRGHRVTLLAGCEPGEIEAQSLTAASLGLEPRLIPWMPGTRGPRQLFAQARAFRSAFEGLAAAGRPDAMLFNQPLSAWAVVRTRAARTIPSLYTFHSPWPIEWALTERIPISGGRPAGGIRSAVEFGARRWIEGKALAGSTAITVLSEYMRSLLLEIHPRVRPADIFRIPGGVDLERFRPLEPARRARKAALGIPPDAPLLLTVRRLVPRMGVDALIGAFRALRREFPDLRLAIGGAGPIEGQLRALARSLGLETAIRFLGFVPDGALPGLYAAADLFVLPTAGLEGFGLVTIEALACGTPVVGTPVGATPEILRGIDSRLVARGPNARAIADAVAGHLRLPLSERRAIAAMGRRRVELYHDAAKIGEALEALLVTIAGGSGSSLDLPAPSGGETAPSRSRESVLACSRL